MIDFSQVRGLGGQPLIGVDGVVIGGIGDIYVDEDSGALSWVTVNIGSFGSVERLVPTDQARLVGPVLVVPYDKKTVKRAPDVDGREYLSAAEAGTLFAYYRLQFELDRVPRAAVDASNRAIAGIIPQAQLSSTGRAAH